MLRQEVIVRLGEEDIKNTYLNPTSALYEEPENLLKQEVRESALYNAIITAIAAGVSHMSEIARNYCRKVRNWNTRFFNAFKEICTIFNY